MTDPSFTPMTECNCLKCGRKVDTLGNPEGAGRPKPGSLIVCIRCGAVMVLSEEWTLRGMTDAEIEELFADTETMDVLAQRVHQVHMIRHSQS